MNSSSSASADGTATPRRFPQSVYGVGEEPDPRFTLANERTFLAWIRTSLALSAAGVALEALELPIAEGLRLACALVLIGLGLLAPLQAWLGWTATERALRRGRPLPSPRLAPVVALGTLVAGVLLVLGLLLR
ncbi:YidH family protein [Blastococcus sp. SYSU D00669]